MGADLAAAAHSRGWTVRRARRRAAPLVRLLTPHPGPLPQGEREEKRRRRASLRSFALLCGLGGLEWIVVRIPRLAPRWRDAPRVRRAFPPYKLGCRAALNGPIQKIGFCASGIRAG